MATCNRSSVGYITLAEQLSSDRTPKLEKAFNFGPSSTNATSVSEVIREALKYWSGPVEESQKTTLFMSLLTWRSVVVALKSIRLATSLEHFRVS